MKAPPFLLSSKLLFPFLIFLTLVIKVNSQSNSICFDVEEINFMTTDDFDNLPEADKYAFTVSKSNYRITKYVDCNGHIATRKVIYSTENLYPAWYSEPTIIHDNASGTLITFAPLSGTANDFIKNLSQSNGLNRNSEDRTIFIPKDNSSSIGTRTLTIPSNPIEDYIYTAPSTTSNSEWTANGYTVQQNGAITTYTNSSETHISDANNNLFISNFYDSNGSIELAERSKYVYISAINETLLDKEHVLLHEFASDGTPIESNVLSTYSNYSTLCPHPVCPNSAAPRYEIQNLKLGPNPSRNSVNIVIPNSRIENKIILKDVNGKIALIRSVPKGLNKYTLDLNSVQSGMYIIHCLSDEYDLTNRLIKQ